jgi:hypothetical protein
MGPQPSPPLDSPTPLTLHSPPAPTPPFASSSAAATASRPAATGALPARPSLEQLKNQAKRLLAAARGGDPFAQERMARYFPTLFRPAAASGAGTAVGPPPNARPRLTQAQLVIAREHGFTSWARLRRAVELAPLRAQLERFVERHWDVRREARDALLAAGPDGMEVALEGLAHPHPGIRRGAVAYLDHTATDASVPLLARLALHDPAPDVRRTAVHALICERCKTSPLQADVLPVLVRAFRQDTNRRVRFNAALPLRRHAERPDVQQAFRQAVLEDPSGLVRRAAISGLRGDDTLPLLERVARHDPEPLVRVSAASRLARHAAFSEMAFGVLEAIAESDGRSDAKRDAHHALRRLSPEYRRKVAERAREANLARAASSGAPSTAPGAAPAAAPSPGAEA